MKIRKRFVRWFGNAKAQNAAGFKENKWQFISILLMAFLGVYIFTGVGGEWAGVENFRTKYYSETKSCGRLDLRRRLFERRFKRPFKALTALHRPKKECYLQIEGADDVAPQIYFLRFKRKLP